MKGRVTDDTKTKTKHFDDRLPILIIPGFMSSGLRIKSSKEYPAWNGKRLWLNIGSLGFERIGRMHAAKPWQLFHEGLSNIHKSAEIITKNNDSSIKEQDQIEKRSLWLQHMKLQQDLRSDMPGIQVEAIPGLDGISYMYPSFMTNMATYVFGPLIDFLTKEGGYTPNVNLQGAPWDWRLPPNELESRDQYFTKTIQQIEDLYKISGNTPVVLLAHSLGVRVTQYLLKIALDTKGQQWIDTHVHTFMPVSGTHLGVPKSIKQVVLVDKSCLDPFLTFEQEMIFSQRLGSTPWMFPQRLPDSEPSVVWVKRQTIMELTFPKTLNVQNLIQNRKVRDRPKSYQIQVVLGSPTINGSADIQSVSTDFLAIDTADGSLDLTTESITFVLGKSTYDQILANNSKLQIQIFLREPGVTKSQKDKFTQHAIRVRKSFTCIEWFRLVFTSIFKLLCCIFDGLSFPLNIINDMTIGASAVLGVSKTIPLIDFDIENSNNKKYLLVDIVHVHDSSSTCFHDRTERQRTTSLSCQIAIWTNEGKPLIQRPELKDEGMNAAYGFSEEYCLTDKVLKQSYQPMSGHEFMRQEGPRVQRYLESSAQNFIVDSNAAASITSTMIEAPPVKRIRSIYGVNVPPEIGAFYRRVDGCQSTRRFLPKFELDPSPSIVLESPHKDRYFVDSCLLKEFPSADRLTGDGTVPYWSLSWIKEWEDSVEEVSVMEIDGADHRDILGMKAFQEEVLRYCKSRKEEV